MEGKYHLDALIIKTIIAKLPNVQAIYRYGSAGSIYERSDSDIDIAILTNQKVLFEEIAELSVTLMSLTGRDFDLHELRKLPVTLRVQIVLQGERIYCADQVVAESYATNTLSEYVRLNEERQFILKDIRQREQIYG